jgi:RNA-directed DNA polymerase
VNTDESELALCAAERRVREIQTKLHRWARDDRHRRLDDLFDLVADPAFLLVAWDRVGITRVLAPPGSMAHRGVDPGGQGR